MFHRFSSSMKLTLMVTMLTLFGFVRTAQSQITVKVNDEMVRFDRTGPQEINGSVFIPLRNVGESMGVDIHWEEASQSITGTKSPHVFVLKLGSRSASVDDREVTLSNPARRINGVTMVPLRFVAEALGAEVRWRSDISQVSITSGDGASNNTPAPTPTPAPKIKRVTGEVVSVQSKGNSPTITIRTSTGRAVFNISQETIILRGLQGEKGSPIDFEQIVLGNTVEIRPDPSGSIANSIKELVAAPVRSTKISGEIISLQSRSNPPTISIRTENGRIRFEVTNDTVVLSGPVGSRGVQTDLERLSIGSKVEIHTDASGAIAVSIRAYN